MVRSSSSISSKGDDNAEHSDLDDKDNDYPIKFIPHISAGIVLQGLRMRKKRKYMN